MPIITNDILKAKQTLLQGDLVAIPTETVYGLAADATNPTAVAKVFALKQRPHHHPLILHVLKEWDLSQWCINIPDYVTKLINAYWPGPLTLVLQKKEGAFDPLVTGGQSTIAIRAPRHPVAQALLKEVGRPLVAPSANPFKKVSPTTSLHVAQSFSDTELLILEGGRCDVGLESTILQATSPNHYAILRHGVLDESVIRAMLVEILEVESSKVRAPGQMAQHYQPQTPLYYFESKESLNDFVSAHSEKIYVMSFSSIINGFNAFQLSSNPSEVAFELYYQLRLADTSSASIIAVELPPKTKAWAAVYERILKAGTPPP